MRHAEHSAASWQISILAYWHISNLLTMQHYKALFTLGIPIVIGQIGVIILGFADTLMIGHHSTNELAAASFVNNMFTLAIIFATGFSYGLTPIVGSLFGRGETHVVGRMLKNSLFANTLLAVLLTLIMKVCRNTRCAFFFFIDYKNRLIFLSCDILRISLIYAFSTSK